MPRELSNRKLHERTRRAGLASIAVRRQIAQAWLNDQIAAGRLSAEIDLEVLAKVAAIIVTAQRSKAGVT